MITWAAGLIALIILVDLGCIILIGIFLSSEAALFAFVVALIVSLVLFDFILGNRKPSHEELEGLIAEYRARPMDEC